MFEHQDALSALNEGLHLGRKLERVHRNLQQSLPFLTRIAAALYDEKTDLLKTFVHSSDARTPLNHYQAKLSDAGSLRQILETGKPRVVNDIAIFSHGQNEHTKKIAASDYRASYTMPMYAHGAFFGFIFFNASQPDVFTEDLLNQLDAYGHLIALMILNDLSAVETLLATVKTARDVAHVRDDETGAHQDRMSRYARLIARRLADKYGFSDEHIEKIFAFSPLHDIGKIGVPDAILLKPDSLTQDEYRQMQQHTVIGRALLDKMLSNFSLDTAPHIEILRNIAEFHHEALDGSGYPHGRSGDDIPIEARIVAVADVFDALTSDRPYKKAWNNQEAFAMLMQLSGIKLDPDCVAALTNNADEVIEIQQRFRETTI